MSKGKKVTRPSNRDPNNSGGYTVVFATLSAKRGWDNLRATIPGPLTQTYDFLSREPLTTNLTNYALRGALGTVSRGGESHQRWQHKPTMHGGQRIWFYVEGTTVHIEQVHTHHPNNTK